jgi:hypothetical protein
MVKAASRSPYLGERRIDIIEIVDQWHGTGYRYVKVRAYDTSVYILRIRKLSERKHSRQLGQARFPPHSISLFPGN